MKIRDAELSDVDSMVRLSDVFRAALATWSPTFWRKADGSFESQVAFFRILLPLDDTLALVADGDSGLQGFIVGRLQHAPPVYAPGAPSSASSSVRISAPRSAASSTSAASR